MAEPGIEIGVDESGEPIVLTPDEFIRLDVAAAGGDPGETFGAVLRGEFRKEPSRLEDLFPFGGDAA